jgi:choline dehydrogenase-like flavoprotein
MTRPIVVIGSGPAGVTAARPLIEAGLPVMMIDAGFASGRASPNERPTLQEIRSGRSDGWRYLVGEDLRGVRLMPTVSPKLRLAANPENLTDFAPQNAIHTDNFVPIGALAQGGLSNFWGAVTFAYDRADMAGWPIDPADLAPSYRKLSERIGISGPVNDELDRESAPLVMQDPLPLSALEARVAARCGQGQRAQEFRVGRTRMAVLTADRPGRSACTLDNACMLGCTQGSIYSSAQEIPELAQAPNVTFEYGFVADRLRRDDGGWTVLGHARRSGARREIEAAKIVLAAGALASTRLGLDAAGTGSETARLESSPAFAFPILFPRSLGAAVPARAFGLAQIAFTLSLGGGDDPADEMLGLLYPAGANSATEFLARMPVTRPGGIRFLREMIPALMIGFVFFPGRYSANRVRLTEPRDGVPQLAIQGGHVAEFPRLAHAAVRRLRWHFLRLGGFVLPGSLQIFRPGADVHYAGPLAMGARSDRLGEINGAPGLHAVDGAALPSMSARNPTLTIMANADRIGMALAEVWRNGFA